MFGYKPYDSSITPVESVWTNIQAAGEGGHNFHHTFPQVHMHSPFPPISIPVNTSEKCFASKEINVLLQDYRASEFGYMTNWTRAMLDGMAYLGMVYDRKTVSIDVINRQKANRGDPDHAHHHRH